MIKSTKVTGLKELEKSLLELSKTYADPKYAMQALRPALKEAAKPIEDNIRRNTPVDEGTLRDSTTTKVKKTNKKDKSILGQDAVMHAEVGWTWVKGRSLMKQGLAVEYGTTKDPARAVLRTAIGQEQDNALNIFKHKLRKSIEKKAAQLGRKFGKPK